MVRRNSGEPGARGGWAAGKDRGVWAMPTLNLLGAGRQRLSRREVAGSAEPLTCMLSLTEGVPTHGGAP